MSITTKRYRFTSIELLSRTNNHSLQKAIKGLNKHIVTISDIMNFSEVTTETKAMFILDLIDTDRARYKEIILRYLKLFFAWERPEKYQKEASVIFSDGSISLADGSISNGSIFEYCTKSINDGLEQLKRVVEDKPYWNLETSQRKLVEEYTKKCFLWYSILSLDKAIKDNDAISNAQKALLAFIQVDEVLFYDVFTNILNDLDYLQTN